MAADAVWGSKFACNVVSNCFSLGVRCAFSKHNSSGDSIFPVLQDESDIRSVCLAFKVYWQSLAEATRVPAYASEVSAARSLNLELPSNARAIPSAHQTCYSTTEQRKKERKGLKPLWSEAIISRIHLFHFKIACPNHCFKAFGVWNVLIIVPFASAEI